MASEQHPLFRIRRTLLRCLRLTGRTNQQPAVPQNPPLIPPNANETTPHNEHEPLKSPPLKHGKSPHPQPIKTNQIKL